MILIHQIGLAFFLLASTSVLLQQWFFKTSSRDVPYHWYSLSNLGSLIALISYPFFVEVNFPVYEQKHYWLLAFGGFIILQLVLMISLRNSAFPEPKLNRAMKLDDTPLKNLWLWIALSATSTTMLIATTQMISTNIPPMPFVWILPLIIYLVSYTYSFSSISAYKRTFLLPFLLFAIAAGLMMYFIGSQFNATSQLTMFSLILLICCLVCHGELRTHAPNNESMTLFYVAISLGGALGSVFTALLAPLLFQRITEYPLGLLLVLLLFAWCGSANPTKPLPVKVYISWTTAVVLFIVGYFNLESAFTQYDIASKRSFYGYLAVKDIDIKDINERRLIDGTTVHGSQPLKSEQSSVASYYQEDSGISTSFSYLKRKNALSIGVIGLGAGVLASYTRPSDKMSFYELNPDVYHMASKYFTYLDNAKGKTEVIINDGRVALKNRKEKQSLLFDALIIDAFSSDVIPAHLLTQEAFELYWQNLKQDGLLILHISNNHIDLLPVLQGHSHQFEKGLIQFKSLGKQKASFGSDWIVLTSDLSFLTSFGAHSNKVKSEHIATNPIKWTDQHYSLLPLIKY
ncbi:fused MFS/spermidine synthase [Pseudoalteromonas piscicida]|uniref:fused MFS/spermidine synthase n=1 Tax=Pseudoalteromonas piscicida TaxID=43662 RepID=UPI001F5C094E|nr:fused MFS/spermidine synthase [Pseudoalteromonas piscicida]